MGLLYGSTSRLEGTSQVKSSAAVSRVKVSADGHGVVSHAGMGMVRELADLTGLSAQVTAALADTYRGPWAYEPARCSPIWPPRWPTGRTASTASGSSCGDREHVFGRRRVDDHDVAAGRSADRRRASARYPCCPRARTGWRGLPGPPRTLEKWLHLDVDATITIDHSDNKENAAATWKKTWGHHSLLVFLDRPEIAGGEALAGLLRAGNAGSNTAADHITVLGWALESLPAAYRPNPTILARQRFWCAPIPPVPPTRSPPRAAPSGWGSPSATPSTPGCGRRGRSSTRTGQAGIRAIDSDGDIRDGAWVAEATGLVEMSSWPAGTRLILRKERPHPGAQLRFTDSDGLRVTAFITDTPPGVVPGQLGGLELRHRQHARVEDRIRQAKATGLRNLPCHRSDANAAWLEIIMAATDLVAWTKLLGFKDQPDLAKSEIDTFRYRVLHVAARITRGARQIRMRIDATWRWATAISEGWQRLRTAFT